MAIIRLTDAMTESEQRESTNTNFNYLADSEPLVPVAVLKGGTGATTASGARTNLSAAKSGANSDITSLSGLTGTVYTTGSVQADNDVTVGGDITVGGDAAFAGNVLKACCATGTDSSLALNTGSITKVPLAALNPFNDASVFSISDGGVKVAVAGNYMIQGSVYISLTTSASAAIARGVYIYQNATEINTAMEYS